MEIIDSTQSVLRSVLLIDLLHNGQLSWVDLAVAQHLPQGRCQGDRHLNFRESRDNLPTTPDTAAAPSAVIPMATPPQPGTAVNDAARSIVCLM